MAMTFDAEALPSLRTIASVLGGVVSGRSVLAPGPDHHSPQDRSLSVTPDAKASGGFLVHSFAGDDELRCKDYVREKLAMPAFKPARERERVQQSKKPISTTRMRPAVPCLVRYGCNMATARRKFGKRRLQNKVAQPPVDTTIRGVNIAHEIRVYLRQSADRRKEISKAIASGDDSVISAILSAPPMLSGLSSQDIEALRQTWQQRQHPDEMKRLGVLERAHAAVQRGGQLLVSHQRKMAAPAVVSEAKKFQQASADAIARATGAQ